MINLFEKNKVASVVIGIGLLSTVFIASDSQVQQTQSAIIQGADLNGSVSWSVGYMWSDKLLWADGLVEQISSFGWTGSYRGYTSRGLM